MKTSALRSAVSTGCLLLLYLLPVFTQSPAPDCENIITLCNGELNAYSGNLQTAPNPTGPFPLCFHGGIPHNTQWFAFVPGTAQLTFFIEPSNCTGAGLQAGIVSDCSDPYNGGSLFDHLVDCQANCNGQNPFTLGGDFIPGQRYYLYLDGCEGSVCDYFIGLVEGDLFAPLLQPQYPVIGPLDVCQGEIASYYLPLVEGASHYEWTTSPPVLFVADENELFIQDWLGNSQVEICVTASNDCYSASPQCLPVQIANPFYDS